MSERQFGISTDIYCTNINTNRINCQDVFADTLTTNNVDLQVGGSYKIGGAHVLSTPVNGSSVSLGNTLSIGQGTNSVAIGTSSGQSSQGQNSVAIGSLAGQTTQGQNSVAIGSSAGQTNQAGFSVAVGNTCGSINQGQGCVAVGLGAAYSGQGLNSVALGNYASGNGNLDGNSVLAGYHACLNGAGGNNVVVGSSACANAVIGTNNTCIGDSISATAGINDSIVIGAGAVANASSQFVLASAAHPLTLVPTAGPVAGYVFVTLNGQQQKFLLFDP